MECSGKGRDRSAEGSWEHQAQLLRDLDVFAEVGEGVLDEMLAAASWETYGREEQIVESGAGEDVTYVIVEGLIRLARCSPEGRVLAQTDLGRGNTFDFGTLFGVRGDAIIGTVVVEATICLLPWPVFLRAVIGAPASAAVVIGQLRRERQYFADLAGDAVLHDLSTRVRHVVRHLALHGEGHVVGLSGEEIAGLAGTSEEAVSRVVAELTRRGSVHRTPCRRLVVPDPDELL